MRLFDDMAADPNIDVQSAIEKTMKNKNVNKKTNKNTIKNRTSIKEPLVTVALVCNSYGCGSYYFTFIRISRLHYFFDCAFR